MDYKILLRVVLILVTYHFSLVTSLAQSDRDCIRKGNRLYRWQEYGKAEAEYRKALSQNGQNAQAHYNLGCALLMQQKDSAAVEQFQQAGRIETNKFRRSQAFHNIGVVCQNHQMYSEAIEAYKESLRNNPADNETRYNLALCQQLEKKQPKNKQNNNQNDKNDKNKDKKDNQQQNKDKQQNKQEDKNPPENKPQEMSKENAEQLLNAVTQQEKQTQQRLKKAMQQPRSKHLQKNW